MFNRQPTVLTLTTVLENPDEYEITSFSSPDFVTHTYVCKRKSQNHELCIVSMKNLNDFDTASFSIKNLCIYLSCHFESSSSSIKIMLMNFFLLLDRSDSQTDKVHYLEQFYGATTFDELYATHPQAAELLMMTLFDFERTSPMEGRTRLQSQKRIPDILVQYADYLARQFTSFPPELLEEVDLRSIASQSYYKDLPPKANFYLGKEEGYWELNYVNKDIFAAAKTMLADDALTAEGLQQLKSMVLEREKPDEEHRYPIPEPKPWLNQDKLLKCLRWLENIARYNLKEIKTLLALRVHDESILNNLIYANVVKLDWCGPSPERLPINYYSCSDYAVRTSDNSLLTWTEALTKYIALYNILPSSEFLVRFDNFLQHCRTTGLDAAKKLEQYLNEHPLQIEARQASVKCKP